MGVVKGTNFQLEDKSTRDIVDNMMTTVNTAVQYIRKLQRK